MTAKHNMGEGFEVQNLWLSFVLCSAAATISVSKEGWCHTELGLRGWTARDEDSCSRSQWQRWSWWWKEWKTTADGLTCQNSV